MNLEAQMRQVPRRVVPLRLGDRHRGGPPPVLIGQDPARHRRQLHGVRCTARCGLRCSRAPGPCTLPCELLRRLAYRRQRLHLLRRRRLLPLGQPLRVGELGVVHLPVDGAARLRLRPPGALPRLLVQQPQRPLRRRLPVDALPLGGQPGQLADDGDAAGGELAHHLRVDTADLAPIAIRPGHHHKAQVTQPGLDKPVRDRRHPQPVLIQRPAVQGPPLAVGLVGALHPVPHRHVHVELGVAVAGDVVQEQRRGQPVAVAPLPGARTVVAGAGIGGVLLQPAHRVPGTVHHRLLDRIGHRVEGLRTVGAVLRTGLHRRDPVGGVQHRHRLDRRDGQVKIGHRAGRGLGALLGAELGDLRRRGAKMLLPPGPDRGLLRLRVALALVAGRQHLPARPDVLHEQRFEHLRVHLPGQAQPGRGAAGPLARRLPALGVVGHRPGAADTIGVGEIPNVVAFADADERRHGASQCAVLLAGEQSNGLSRPAGRRGPDHDHFRDACVRERALHGGKVTQPTDTRRARGCLSARSLAYVRHPAHTRKGGRKGFQPGLGSRYMQASAWCHGRHREPPGRDAGLRRGLHRAPGRRGAPQPGPDVRGPGCGARACAAGGGGPRRTLGSARGQIAANGYDLLRGKCPRPRANGSTGPASRTVIVRDDLSPAQACKTLGHEHAHIVLGHVDNVATYQICRGQCEVQAESVAYLVCTQPSIDSGEHFLPDVASCAASRTPAAKATGTTTSGS